MERLTERSCIPAVSGDVLVRGRRLGRAYFNNQKDYQDYSDALEKLAQYEDAEENGLLVRLPQKIVYAIGWGKGKNCDNLCPASIDGVGCCSLCDHGELIIYEEECNQAHLPYIGKTVFLSREEAEKALEGMNDFRPII